jgi:CRISPR-associated endonuclease Csn1
MNENYNIGLDLGSDSVGWACVDSNNNIIVKNKKNMWGSRLFDQALSKKDTRLHRSSRRHYLRRKIRINYLNNFVADDMNIVDPEFFNKMDESFKVYQDREKDSNGLSWALQFFKSRNDLLKATSDNLGNRLPTIYHLRNYCMQDNKVDFRIVYLCLHHILKYRGNFLYEGQEFNIDKFNLDNMLKDFFDLVRDNIVFDLPTEIDYEKIKKIINDKTYIINDEKKFYNTSKKIDDIIKLFNFDKKSKPIEGLLKLCFGNTCNFLTVFEDLDTTDDKLQISFKENYEEKQDELSSLLGDRFDIVESAKNIYSYITLNKILSGEKYLSKAMIKSYDEHKADLKDLKNIVKKYLGIEEYKLIFSDNKIVEETKDSSSESENLSGNSSENIDSEGSSEKPKKTKVVNYEMYIHKPKSCSQSDFNSFLENKLKDLVISDEKDCIVYNHIMERLHDRIFLPRQTTTSNGEIPMQCNEDELKLILDKQGKFYPTLQNHKQDIIKLFEFRIPYFVGPLNNNSRFSWIVKNNKDKNEKITPFNFDSLVNKEETERNFIERMLNSCEYLPEEKCMPKNSLTCEKFEVLQELNNISINDKKFGKDEVLLKQNIFNNLFKTRVSVSEKNLIDYLTTQEGFNKDIKIKGLSNVEKFNSSLSTYNFLIKLGYSDEQINDNWDKFDDLIKDLTIFDEGQIRTNIVLKYKDLVGKNTSAFVNHKFKGWSRISKKLISGLKNSDIDNKTILDLLWDTNFNLMNFINNKDYSFRSQIEKIQNTYYEKNSNSIKKIIDDSYCSPAVKRTIWQTILIVNELEKIMGKEPDRIFVEFNGEEGIKNGIKDNRYKKLLSIYKKIIDENKNSNVDANYFNNFSRLKTIDKEKQRPDNDMIYLYYLQNGKSLYSGQDLGEPSAQNLTEKCEIDHIIPRSLKPDNSFDNRALVLKSENQNKADGPLSYEIRSKMSAFWDLLFKQGLISSSKLKNLHTDCFDEKVVNGFVNRQLVETRQSVREVLNILRVKYPDIEINNQNRKRVVPVNGSLSSNYRELFGIYKSRIINDCHHAHDAYLASVLGAYLYRKFPVLDSDIYYANKFKKDSFLKDINKRGHYLAIIQELVNDNINTTSGEIIWSKTYNNTIRENIFGTSKTEFNGKKCFISSMNNKDITGQFYNATIYPKKEGLIPVNKNRSNTALYGGYSSVKPAYFVVVDYIKTTKKGDKHSLSIEGVNTIDIVNAKLLHQNINDYLIQNCYKKDGFIVKILNTLNINQLLEVNKFLIYKTGNKDIQNAKTLYLSYNANKTMATIKDNKINYNILANNDDELKFKDKLNERLNEWLINLYDELSAVSKKSYAYLPTFNANIFEDYKDKFKSYNLFNKINLMNNLFYPFGRGCMDLSKFGLRSNYGRLLKVIDCNKDKVYIINKSVTGFYETRTLIGSK